MDCCCCCNVSVRTIEHMEMSTLGVVVVEQCACYMMSSSSCAS